MNDQMRALWDCRVRDGQHVELILPDSREPATTLKGLRDSESQAICHLRIRQVPQNQRELENDEDASMLMTAIGPGNQFRYDRVVVVRRDEQENVSGVIETIRRFRPELIEQNRLFVTAFRAAPDEAEFVRALQAAHSVVIESP
jgi:hypothetical protein